MGHKKIFEIPDNQEIIVKLVEAVPLSWTEIKGMIEAPASLIISGQVAADTGYLIGMPEHKIVRAPQPFFRTPEYNLEPDLISLIIERKLPCFIIFKEDNAYLDSFETALKIALDYLKKGYRGRISFEGPFYRERRILSDKRVSFVGGRDERYLERCTIELAPYGGGRLFIELEWGNKPEALPELVEPIIAACHELDLKELQPVR